MLSNLKKEFNKTVLFPYFTCIIMLFLYSFRCLAITTVRFHFICWWHCSHMKTSVMVAEHIRALNPKITQLQTYVPKTSCGAQIRVNAFQRVLSWFRIVFFFISVLCTSTGFQHCLCGLTHLRDPQNSAHE